MNNLLKKYNLKYIKNNIRNYGYKYTTGEFILQMILIISIIVIIAYISKLEYISIIFLIVVGLVLIPGLITSWFSYRYQVKRFKMLVDYISNIIPIFMQKTKIRYALEEVHDLTSAKMKKVIGKAIDYIDHNYDDTDILKGALKIIEKEFPNSRVKSVHKLMLTIEKENSTNYQDVCQNLFVDIDNWIKRVYNFHSDLKNRRNKLIILCIITLCLNCLFVYLYVSNDYFKGFTDIGLYQISTTIFIASILVTIAIILSKLHGEWLVNDMSHNEEARLKRAYDFLKKGKSRFGVVDIVICLIILFIGLYYFFIVKDKMLGIVIFLLAYLVINARVIRYNSSYRFIKRSIEIEFPMWLREISLSLNNMTVLNAIESSTNSVSYAMKKEIESFLEAVRSDPTSIKPYTNFLLNYDLQDATSTMKVLYSIQNIGDNHVENQISNLIRRNQEMLNKAESLRNNSSITGIEMIGYIPIVLFSLETLCSLFTLFIYIVKVIGDTLVMMR